MEAPLGAGPLAQQRTVASGLTNRGGLRACFGPVASRHSAVGARVPAGALGRVRLDFLLAFIYFGRKYWP